MKKLLIAVALLVPLPLAAQTGSTLTPYVATDGSIAGTPLLVGANYSREYGWLALRLGAGLSVGTTPRESEPEEGSAGLGIFMGDMDALLYAGSPARWSEPVIPYLLVGASALALTGAADRSLGATYSYGAGLRMPVASWLTLDGEMRYRRPFEGIATPLELRSGFEFRFGASLRMTGRRPRVTVPPLANLPLLTSTGVPGTAGAVRRDVATRAIDAADDYLGVPYVWGGNTPSQGFDCSGFVRWVFASQGIHLPRTSYEQARAGVGVPLDLRAFEPGDLLAFSSRGGRVDHIAIYVGNGRIIHASASARAVRYDNLYTPRGGWYIDHLVGARRVIDGIDGWRVTGL